MKRSTKIVLAVILMGIFGTTSGYYFYQYPKIPSYQLTNATNLTEKEYFSNYNLPNCVVDHLNSSSLELIPKYYSGFEKLSDFEAFYLTPQNHLGTTSHNLVSEHTHSGNYAHKAWVQGSNHVVAGENTNHRGYPTIQLQKTDEGILTNRFIVDFWVWLDISLENTANKNWFSFATFTNYQDDSWYRTSLINLDSNNIMHLMHVPNQGESDQNIFQTTNITFPMKEWVRITAFVDLTDDNVYNQKYILVWQNQELVSGAIFDDRINPNPDDPNLPECLANWDGEDIAQAEELCGLNYSGGFAQAHFGMYCPPLIRTCYVYNDDLMIAEIIKT